MSLISGVRELHECSLSTVGMLVAPSVVDKYSASKPIVSNRDTRNSALYAGPLTSDLSQGHHTKKIAGKWQRVSLSCSFDDGDDEGRLMSSGHDDSPSGVNVINAFSESHAVLSIDEKPDGAVMGSLRSPLRSREPGLRFGRLSPSDLSSRGLSTRPTAPTAQGLENCCRAMIAQAAEAIILTDSAGTIRLWNHGAERIFGYSAGEVLGSVFMVVVPPRLRGTFWAGFRQSIDSGRIANRGDVLRMQATRKSGGTLYVDLSFGLVRDEVDSVVGAFAIGRDCTARHLAEKAMVLELQRQTRS
jgi:PAS domain S-box-containing protein